MSTWPHHALPTTPSGSHPPFGTGALSNAASRPGNRPGPCRGRRGARCRPSRRRTAQGSHCHRPRAPGLLGDPFATSRAPALTTHDREPSRSTMQSAFSWHGLGEPSGQKRCPRRRQPDVWSPTKPGRQGPHWKEPCAQARSDRQSGTHARLASAILTIPAFLTRVLTHTESGTQLCCPVSHSLISMQIWGTEITGRQHTSHPGHASLQPVSPPRLQIFLTGTRVWIELSVPLTCLLALAKASPTPSWVGPLYPGGQASQRKPGLVLTHRTRGKQG